MYNSVSPSAQTGIENCIAPLVRSMSQNKAASQRLINLVRSAPEGSENLVLKVLMIMTELVKPSIKLIETVKHVVAEKKLDMQFIAPIMAGLVREEILVYLPKLFLMLDGTPGRKMVVAEIISRLTATDMNNGKAAIDAVDILCEVNNMDSQIGLKKCLEGMGVIVM
jgi:symplekin